MDRSIDIGEELDFAILFTPKGFTVNQRPADSTPMILGPDGALHEGAAQYFVQKMGWEGATAGTMRVHGYAIKDWLTFMHSRGIDWQQPTDNLLSDWAGEQAGEGIGSKRLDSKLMVIFGFYHTLQSIGVVQDIVENPLLLDTNADGSRRRFPISVEIRVVENREGTYRQIRFRPRVQYRDPRTIRGGRRYTPSEKEVEQVLDHLLDRSALDEYARVRNFFCARVMVNMGLRREGTASLTTTALEAALKEVGIIVPDFATVAVGDRARMIAAGWVPWLRGLDAIAKVAEEQERILGGLADLESRYRRNVYVAVIEKGRKRRIVPMPIQFMKSVLVEWVWGRRAGFIEDRRRRYPSYVPPETLWLSKKSGLGMTMAAIANEMKAAFSTLQIDASGHRLRAYFLTELVRELYLVARAAHGRMFDARTILDQAAEIAGHSDTQSLQPYLSRVMKEDTFRPGEQVLVEDPADAAMLRGLADTLATAGDDVTVPMRRMLKMLLDKFGVERPTS